ncbi:putative leader peptide [Streptomyces stramineus]
MKTAAAHRYPASPALVARLHVDLCRCTSAACRCR